MIPRFLSSELHRQLAEFPLVTVLGPRQAGKTTLAQRSLPDFDYVSLETPDERAFAQEDPRGFFGAHPHRVILDEVQRVPELLSYLQGVVDRRGTPGQFVLTGSHQLELRQAITQSLAGRTSILHLLPLSLAELEAADYATQDFATEVFHGFLPRVRAAPQRPRVAYSSYFQTYVERDVRQLIQLKDAALFEKFMKLLAGRVGQAVNFQSLGGDVGVDAKTLKHWLSILEASFIVFRLPPYFENFGKRVIKSPKYYFTDTGLLASLLGIESAEQVARDPLVGSMFENLVVLEALKARFNLGSTAELYFFRDNHGKEIDLLHRSGSSLVGIEIKSSSTYHASFKANLQRFHERVAPLAKRCVIYSGKARTFSDGTTLLPFAKTASVFTE